MFLLLLQSLFSVHLLTLPHSTSCFPPLLSFLLLAFFFSLFWAFSPLEHIGNKRRKSVKGEGFGGEIQLLQ